MRIHYKSIIQDFTFENTKWELVDLMLTNRRFQMEA